MAVAEVGTRLRLHVGSPEPDECGEHCPPYIRKVLDWSKQFNGTAAMLMIPGSPDVYLETVGAKTRNMIRKAERAGYEYRQFEYNASLDAIYEVNTSKAERQGRPMKKDYLQRPTPILGKYDLCELHHHVWIGGYLAGTLRAYCKLILSYELAVIDTILGHADSLADGVMDGLVLAMLWACECTPVKAINYMSLETVKPGLRHFKTSVGFRELPVEMVA